MKKKKYVELIFDDKYQFHHPKSLDKICESSLCTHFRINNESPPGDSCIIDKCVFEEKKPRDSDFEPRDIRGRSGTRPPARCLWNTNSR